MTRDARAWEVRSDYFAAGDSKPREIFRCDADCCSIFGELSLALFVIEQESPAELC